MRNIFSTTAIAALLVATSIASADARAVRSSVRSTGCAAQAIGSEAQDARATCVHAGAARTVRYMRVNQPRRAPIARHGASCGGRLSIVHAATGATACVARSAAAAFQGFVSALEATGYHIDFMGGWRAHGSCRGCNMHPRGLAIDINQTGRNRVTRRLPAGVTQLAAQFGLLHGAVWAHADAGHFEVTSASAAAAPAERVARREGRHRVAALHVSPALPATDGLAAQGSGYR